jgi:hypothetical protein
MESNPPLAAQMHATFDCFSLWIEKTELIYFWVAAYVAP